MTELTIDIQITIDVLNDEELGFFWAVFDFTATKYGLSDQRASHFRANSGLINRFFAPNFDTTLHRRDAVKQAGQNIAIDLTIIERQYERLYDKTLVKYGYDVNKLGIATKKRDANIKKYGYNVEKFGALD